MASLANNFEVPSWAGKPPPGLHLDVLKDGKMIQKLMIDEKKCYFFGRNKQLCDFAIDHSSCSRVHTALVWHKHLSRPFLIDLGSTHGTFIGTIRLDSKKPQQVPLDSEIHFGASTRMYIIRERPQIPAPMSSEAEGKSEDIEGGLLGLPETETELENLTEFNTAHNRRVAGVSEILDTPVKSLKRRRKSVNFAEEDEIINPEDIDPSVGRFRNMVSTTVIPKKKARPDVGGPGGPSLADSITKRLHNFHTNLYGDLPNPGDEPTSPTNSTYSIATKLGLPLPNLAPDVEHMPSVPQLAAAPPVVNLDVEAAGPKKKKYAKEAWPGKKPVHGLLV